MRSIWAVAAALTMLLSLPLAVLSQALGPNAPEIVVHVVLGTGMLLLVRAAFDFRLPRWINVIGVLSAGAFAVVFLLQALSRLLPENAALHDVAFGLLGNWPERLLVLGLDVWFVGLLLRGTQGTTRLIGWAIIPILTAYHVITLVGAILAITIPSFGVFSFLPPFVWLLIEGAKRASGAVGTRPTDAEQMLTA
jgi:hypothetical protein